MGKNTSLPTLAPPDFGAIPCNTARHYFTTLDFKYYSFNSTQCNRKHVLSNKCLTFIDHSEVPQKSIPVVEWIYFIRQSPGGQSLFPLVLKILFNIILYVLFNLW